MKFVKTDKLVPGMMIARSIYSGRGLMLVANKKLTPEIIQILERNGYTGAYIYDETSNYEEFSEIIPDILRIKGEVAIEDVNIDAIIYVSNQIVEELLSRDSIEIDLNHLSVYDQNTYEHSMNVALTSATCGIVMGLSREKVEELTTSAMLHDVGKSCISKDILNKPGPLTDAERETINLHPQLGYDLLYTHQELSSEVRAGVLCHHENWDGTGYGRGLKGEAIPLFARIIHVADVYDALLQKRAYKGKISQSECIEYLMGGCGTLFDPDVVAAFLKFIAIYPIGSEVMLSDGRIGRVVKNNSISINRPTIVVDEELLDLTNDRNLLNITILGEVSNEPYQDVNELEESK